MEFKKCVTIASGNSGFWKVQSTTNGQMGLQVAMQKWFVVSKSRHLIKYGHWIHILP